MPIADWLGSYKLADYVSLFEAAGFDNTDFLAGITTDDLTDIGLQKPGHRKKIMTALTAVASKEHLIHTKPVSFGAGKDIFEV